MPLHAASSSALLNQCPICQQTVRTSINGQQFVRADKGRQHRLYPDMDIKAARQGDRQGDAARVEDHKEKTSHKIDIVIALAMSAVACRLALLVEEHEAMSDEKETNAEAAAFRSTASFRGYCAISRQ
jgi:hypothetical protein